MAEFVCIYDESAINARKLNVSLESSSAIRCWREEFLEDVKRLLDDEKRRLAQFKYATFAKALSNAIQYLVATKALDNTELHTGKLFHKIDQVTRHINDLIDCDPRYISYVLVSDDFKECTRLFARHKDINSYLEGNVSKCENLSLLHDLNSKVSSFHQAYTTVREAFHDAYMESFEVDSMQMLLNSALSRVLDCDDVSISMFDLVESEHESNATTLLHSASSFKPNKITERDSVSTCSTSASTLPDHSIISTEDGTSHEVFVNCFKWYGRMGQPNRQDMKRFILKDHPEITPQDIDRLPWKSNGRRLDMSFMTSIFLPEEFSLSFTSHDGDNATNQ